MLPIYFHSKTFVQSEGQQPPVVNPLKRTFDEIGEASQQPKDEERETEACARESALLNGNDCNAVAVHCNLLRETKQKEKGLELITKAFSKFPKCAEVKASLISLCEDVYEETKNSNFHKALLCLNYLQQAYLPVMTVKILTKKGDLCAQHKRNDLAEGFYRQVLKIDSCLPEIWLKLGEISILREEYRNAIDNYIAGLQVNLGNASLEMDLIAAKLLFQQKQDEKIKVVLPVLREMR